MLSSAIHAEAPLGERKLVGGGSAVGDAGGGLRIVSLLPDPFARLACTGRGTAKPAKLLSAGGCTRARLVGDSDEGLEAWKCSGPLSLLVAGSSHSGEPASALDGVCGVLLVKPGI